MRVAHFSTICSSRIAEIHVCSAILNKQITKSMKQFFTYSVNLKQDLLFFLIIIISPEVWVAYCHNPENINKF